MLFRFQQLKKLEIHHLEIHIHYLLDILRYLGNMKTQSISVSLGVINELDEAATKNIFKEALEIVNEKFPFPDVRILELKILEKFENPGQPRHSIIYGESGPFLDPEYETSDFSDTSDSDSTLCHPFSGSEVDPSLWNFNCHQDIKNHLMDIYDGS